jgi:hypothetical protein
MFTVPEICQAYLEKVMGIPGPGRCFLISSQLLNAIAPILTSPTKNIPLANAAATVCI